MEATKKPSYEPMLQPSEYLDYIHCDFGGPYLTTRGGNRFHICVQDDVTRKYYAETVRTKIRTFDTIQKFICQEECLSGKRLTYLRTDFGGEFANKAFETYRFKEDVKKWERSAPDTQNQNGKAECFNYTLMSSVRFI